MKKINIGWFCDLGMALAPLLEFNVPNTEDNTYQYSLVRAKEMLENYIDEELLPLSLNVSRPAARELIQEINNFFLPPSPLLATSPRRSHIQIAVAANKLKTIMSNELPLQTVYQVFPKRAYNLDLLIDKPIRIFSADVATKFSNDILHDIGQAGKCLAFELPTAAAFHLFRAAETVIREYYTIIVGEIPKKKMRNWGSYIKILREKNADEKILSALDQIRELHRNPNTHPEATMDIEEALSLMGIMESVMSAMVHDIEVRRAIINSILAPSSPSSLSEALTV